MDGHRECRSDCRLLNIFAVLRISISSNGNDSSNDGSNGNDGSDESDDSDVYQAN